MSRVKKTAIVSKECVACGTCVKVCPRQAITIFKGVFADVEPVKCIGCGKCARVCPAGVITIEEVGRDEKALV